MQRTEQNVWCLDFGFGAPSIFWTGMEKYVKHPKSLKLTDKWTNT